MINEKTNSKLKWEQLDKFTTRLKVPHGWIVEVISGDYSCNALTFVPDVNHEWEVESC